MTKCLIDSNIFVYAFDVEAGEKHKIAKELVPTLAENSRGVASIQNIVEFCRIVTEKLRSKIPEEETKEHIARFKTAFPILYYNTGTIYDALSIMHFHQVHFFDALLAATMKQHQISTIITENEKDFEKIPGIKVVNPFKTK